MQHRIGLLVGALVLWLVIPRCALAISFETHQGNRGGQPCQPLDANSVPQTTGVMAANSWYIVASDDAFNPNAQNPWDYAVDGYVSIHNTNKAAVTLTRIMWYGDGTICGVYPATYGWPSTCYWAYTDQVTIPASAYGMVPFMAVLPNQPAADTMAFYAELGGATKALTCATVSYRTTEHDE